MNQSSNPSKPSNPSNLRIFVLSIPAGPARKHFSVSCTQSKSNPNLVAMQSKKISAQSADDMVYFRHQRFEAGDLVTGLRIIKAFLVNKEN